MKVEMNKIAAFFEKNVRNLVLISLYLIVDVIITRANFGPMGFPQGDNALDFYSSLYFIKKYGLSTWYTLTDWGQPYPGFTGPTILSALPLLNFTLATRLLEFISFFLSGGLTYVALKGISRNEFAAFVGGFYYMLTAETAQFFDGHIPAMLSIALAPFFFYILYLTFKRPTLKLTVTSAFLLYLLASAGDLGILYMILFFAIPAVFLIIAERNVNKLYSLNEILAIVSGALLFCILMMSWLVPYLLGARPQYTTNVTSVVVGFNATAGVGLIQALSAFVADHSYIMYGYGLSTYSIVPVSSYWIYLSLPLCLAVYVIFKRNRKISLLFASGMIAAVFATGKNYGVLSTVNRLAYEHVPYFNYIPALFRWDFILVFVYAVLISMLVSDVVSWLRKWRANDATLHLRLPYFLKLNFNRSYTVKILSIAIALFFVSVAFTQNFLVFSEPPETFQFPASHIQGYEFVSKTPAYGTVLTIPFGSIYSRTPWGKVSQSSIFMSPYFMNRSSVMFQAGTPGSLQLDRLIGDGLTLGYSNNVTKFLEAVNVQYITATKYVDWLYPSDAIYDPVTSYYSIFNQTGIGMPVFNGSSQKVFELSDISGNVSFSPNYYVYFGNSSLVYDVLNEPWYLGASTPLINGDQNGLNITLLVEHSSGIICSPSTLSEVSSYLLKTASSSNVPVIVIADYNSLNSSSVIKDDAPWVSSNGYAFSSSGFDSMIQIPTDAQKLLRFGFLTINISSRQMLLPFSSTTFEYGTHMQRLTNFANSTLFGKIPWTNMSVVSAGINNQGKYPYSGSVVTNGNGSALLNWTFVPNNDTYQYLNFNLSNLSGWNGIRFSAKVTLPLSFIMQAIYSDGKIFSVRSYQVVNKSNNTSEFYLFFPASQQYPLYAHNLDNVQRFVIGFDGKSPDFNRLFIGNFSFFNYTGSANFENFQLHQLNNSGVQDLSVSTNRMNLIDTVTLVFSRNNSMVNIGRPISDKSFQGDPTALSVDLNTAAGEWGILTAAETYNSLWDLQAKVGYQQHIIVNVGLNGWLINTNGNLKGKIIYLGQKYLEQGMIIEGVMLSVVIPLVSIMSFSQKRKWWKK